MWERGSAEDPVHRALTVLCFCTGEPRDVLARYSVGARDRMLIEVHERLFGSTLAAFALCTACGEPLQYSVCASDLLASLPSPIEPPLLNTSGASLRLALPDSLTLEVVSRCPGLAQATRLLVERCIVEASIEGQPVPPHELPESVVEPVSAALIAADPAAEILMELHCTACSHGWQVVLDIERFLWAKISATAKRLLREIHALASAYGWSEPEILALSPARRQAYMEMTWAAS